MIYLKIYEEFYDVSRPEVGDYVCIELKNAHIIKFVILDNKEVINFLHTHIGKIIKVQDDNCAIQFDNNIPGDDNIIFLTLEDIDYFSKNKKDVEVYMQTKKFNI